MSKNSFSGYHRQIMGLLQSEYDVRQAAYGYNNFLTPQECIDHFKKVAKEEKKKIIPSPQLTLF